MELSAGTEIEGYKIIKRLGSGGQSSVYLAVDIRLHRKVAIKLISDSSMADETGRRRFLLEAQTLSSLNHPNIATVFHIGEHRSHAFIAMEFVDGQTLQEYVEGHRPDGEECLRVIASIVEAISYAHQKGFIHRDLKPSNIMVTSNGQIKLLDFGLARITREVERRRLESPPEMTATGVVMGTVYYLSPEQAQTSSSSEKSDLFSLGVILYEMITGKRPFDRDSVLTTLYAIVHAEPPPIRSSDPTLQSLAPVVMRLLEKDPKKRYSSAAELLSVLRGSGGDGALETPPAMFRTVRIVADPKRRKRRLWMLLLLLLICSIVAAWFLLGKGGKDEGKDVRERMAILVLPVRSGPGEQERHLADVITSEIISSLSRTPGLRVLTIPVEFLSGEKNWSERIVRDNAVGFTLKSDLVMNGDKLRLTAQIIDQGDYRVVWTKVFNKEKGRLFAIPSDISYRMAYEAGVILKADQLAFPGEKAFDFYTRADMLLSSYDPLSLPQSIALFRDCARDAPHFRPVYEKLGQALMQYRNIGIDYDPTYLDEAYQIIRKGREIHGDSILLRIQEIWYHLYSYDFDRARDLVDGMMDESLEPTGLKHRIWLSFYMGKTGTSTALLDEAVRREPFDASVHLNRVVLNTMLGDQARVERAYEESREIYRSPMVEAIIEGWRKMSLNDYQEAYDTFSRIGNRVDYRLMDLACAEALFCAGKYQAASTYLESWLGQNPFAMEGWWMLCLCHELNGDKTAQAFAARQAVKNAEDLYRRYPNPFLQTARIYFSLLSGGDERAEIRKFVSQEAGQDSMTRYLRFVCRVRAGLEADLKAVPVPYNPTYWMNRFYRMEGKVLGEKQP